MRAAPRLLDWIELADGDERGVWDLRGAHWGLTTYPDLRDDALRMAAGLRGVGVERDDRVLIALTSGAGFAAALYGAWMSGAVAVPLPSATAFVGGGGYADHVERVQRAVGGKVLVCAGDEPALLAGSSAPRCVGPEELLAADPHDDPDPSETLVLQMTSGSAGDPKAVRITHSCLEAQVAALGALLEWDAGDLGASWLPMHHDMGLVTFVAALMHGSSARMIEPSDFIRTPLKWLQCHGELGAALATVPAFGLEHVVRRIRPRQLEGMDFSGWRALAVGAERIDPTLLLRFGRLLAPHGFSLSAVRPAYGMAETTLATAIVPLGAPLTARRAGASQPTIELAADGELDGADLGGLVVGCGPPLAGMSVVVVDESGVEAPEGEPGQIVVGGTSLAAGYVTDEGRRTTAFDDRIETGDVGFLSGGRLYVLGRAGDGIRLHGQTVLAEDVEVELGRLPGMPHRRFCVLMGQRDGPPLALVLSERDFPKAEATKVVRTMVGPAADVRAVRVRRGSLLWTTSGKPRRNAIWQAYIEGRITPLGSVAPVETAGTV